LNLLNLLYAYLVHPILFILPAYVANGSPVVLAKFVRKRHPIDFGRKFIDGRRVFGDSKSWEGLVFAVLCGTLTGYIENILGITSIDLVEAFTMSMGAMLGDLLGSFIKRRLGVAPGEPAIPMDQLLFVTVALLMLSAIGRLPLNLVQILVLLAITFLLHVGTNAIAYLAKLKPVPW